MSGILSNTWPVVCSFPNPVDFRNKFGYSVDPYSIQYLPEAGTQYIEQGFSVPFDFATFGPTELAVCGLNQLAVYDFIIQFRDGANTYTIAVGQFSSALRQISFSISPLPIPFNSK